MEGFAVLMIILAIVNSISKSKKNKAAKAGKATFPNGPSLAQREAKVQKELEAIKKKVMAQQAAAKAAAQAKVAIPAEGEGFTQPAFSGSLNMDSTEGEDLCDPTLGHEREISVDPESVYAGEIGREPVMDFSARGLLQGVIMSEILTRPAQRRR